MPAPDVINALPARPKAPMRLDHKPTAARPVRVIPRELEREARIAPHRHPWPQVTFALEGAFRVSTPETSWIVPPSRAIWIPELVEHEVVTLDRLAMRTVRVHRGLLKGKWSACRVVEVSPLMREIVAALADPRLIAKEPREAALLTLLIDELRRSTPLPLSIQLPQDKRLRKLCAQLLADPGSLLTLDQWASRVGASSRTLERLFREDLSSSFVRWRQSVRLAHGIALISQGRSVAEAADALGYASQSAFTAMFRRAFGKAPRDFFAA